MYHTVKGLSMKLDRSEYLFFSHKFGGLIDRYNTEFESHIKSPEQQAF